jgi:ribosomal protein L24
MNTENSPDSLQLFFTQESFRMQIRHYSTLKEKTAILARQEVFQEHHKPSKWLWVSERMVRHQHEIVSITRRQRKGGKNIIHRVDGPKPMGRVRQTNRQRHPINIISINMILITRPDSNQPKRRVCILVMYAIDIRDVQQTGLDQRQLILIAIRKQYSADEFCTEKKNNYSNLKNKKILQKIRVRKNKEKNFTGTSEHSHRICLRITPVENYY